VNRKIPYFRHDLGQVELGSLASVLKGDILTTGEAVSGFEAKFASFLDQRHAPRVTSCTGALHMALLALNIGPGDEFITTPMIFFATATAILETGATPVFCRGRNGYRQSLCASRGRCHHRE
jgi:dTDP-4-amino-4,6-dideoxygalactose transaminase